MMVKLSVFLKSLLMGAMACFIAVVVSEVGVGKYGHRINFADLPPAAQAIANETPDVPLTSEQWKRIDEVMNRSGGWSSGRDLLVKTIRKGWYWFLIFPAIGVIFLKFTKQHLKWSDLIGVFSSGFIVLLCAFA